MSFITDSLSHIIQMNIRLLTTGWKVMIMNMNLILREEKSDWTLTLMQVVILMEQTVKTSSSKQIACKRNISGMGKYVCKL